MTRGHYESWDRCWCWIPTTRPFKDVQDSFLAHMRDKLPGKRIEAVKGRMLVYDAKMYPQGIDHLFSDGQTPNS